MSILLELKNVETYYGPVMAIRGVSLEIHKGRIVTLLGANGAGKTTVLKTISGAMYPQKGSVTLYGEAITGLDPDVVARMGVAHVPEGREVFPFLSVEDNLKVGAFSRRDAEIASDLDLVYDYFPALREKNRQQSGSYGSESKPEGASWHLCETKSKTRKPKDGQGCTYQNRRVHRTTGATIARNRQHQWSDVVFIAIRCAPQCGHSKDQNTLYQYRNCQTYDTEIKVIQSSNAIRQIKE